MFPLKQTDIFKEHAKHLSKLLLKAMQWIFIRKYMPIDIYFGYLYFFISFCLFLADCGAGVQTKIVIADFTKGSQVYEHIEKETANIPISILGK